MESDGLWIDLDRQVAGYGDQVLPLNGQEVALLAVLSSKGGRVVTRTELARGAGLSGTGARRPDSLLVSLRRALGADAVRNIRGRGWALDHEAISIPA